MLAVGLSDVKTLDACRIATKFVQKDIAVVIKIPLVKGETHSLVQIFKCLSPFLDQRNNLYGFWRKTGLEGSQRDLVLTLRHSVVYEREEDRSVFGRESTGGRIPTRALDSRDRMDSACVTDRYCVC